LKRITKAALGGLAGCALVLGGTQAATGALFIEEYNYPSINVVDLQQDGGSFDGATATLRVRLTPSVSTFKLTLSGVAPAAAGTEFGAHLHTDECVEGDFGDSNADPVIKPGLKAGPHYNHTKILGDPVVISPKTEVWFDIVSDENGTTSYQAAVPFVPVDPDGTMSVVIHVLSTNPATGGAGDRQACVPLNVSEWAPKTL
jgi:Cu/Zn superoxide dismutase